MNQTFESRLKHDIDKLKAAGTYKSLRHLTTPMASEVHMEEDWSVTRLAFANIIMHDIVPRCSTYHVMRRVGHLALLIAYLWSTN